MNEHDLADLARYKRLLEHPSFVARITSLVGTPMETVMDRLPARWRKSIGNITQAALRKSLALAAATMDNEPTEASPRLHKVAAGVTGAVGGVFGLVSLPVELPVSTTIMLRAIADIARESGEDLAQPAARLECLNVFALGGIAGGDDGAESGYFAVRTALGRVVGEALAYIAERGLVSEGAPALVRLVTTIAVRFQAQVSQKVAMQAVPLIGAASGAAINLAFTDHFQDIAIGHFGVRRLERQYGAEVVREAYARIVL
jgi:hypothetical protein